MIEQQERLLAIRRPGRCRKRIVEPLVCSGGRIPEQQHEPDTEPAWSGRPASMKMKPDFVADLRSEVAATSADEAGGLVPVLLVHDEALDEPPSERSARIGRLGSSGQEILEHRLGRRPVEPFGGSRELSEEGDSVGIGNQFLQVGLILRDTGRWRGDEVGHTLPVIQQSHARDLGPSPKGVPECCVGIADDLVSDRP